MALKSQGDSKVDPTLREGSVSPQGARAQRGEGNTEAGPAGDIMELECSGETHRILLSRRGKLGLLDHDRQEIENEMAIAALHPDAACRCVRALLAWREMLAHRIGDVRYRLPVEMLDACVQVMSKSSQRRRARIDADHAEADARRRPGRRFR